MELMESVVPHPDGAEVFLEAFCAGLKPDPPLWIDEWSEAEMVISADTGARLPGRYRLDTTPFARDVLRALSPESPIKRVVAKVASQLWKTQVGINFICASIAHAPANILALEPTQTLTRRLASRIDKTIAAVPVLRERVAAPRSRDAKNTSDTKEFRGGGLYINTAGSESNLAELTARYIYGDEVDRWLRNVGQEGDPVKLAENRATQFGRAAKFYYSSSPTEKDASKIDDLFEMGDQRYCYVPCPECGHMQILVVEQLRVNDDVTQAHSALFSEITVKGQGSGAGSEAGGLESIFSGKVTAARQVTKAAKDLGIGRYRPYIVISESHENVNRMKQRAEWEVGNREAKSRKYSVTVQGWYQSGQSDALWTINSLVRVVDGRCRIDEEMLVCGVTFMLDERGTYTDLELLSPRAYTLLPEIPKPQGGRHLEKI